MQAHLELVPAGATCKGMFPADVLAKVEAANPDVDLFELAGVPRMPLRLFGDVPFDRYLKMIHAGAKVVHPDLPRGEGLRRVGQSAYDAFVTSQVGRVLLGAAGRNFGRVARLGARAYDVSISFGRVSWIVTGECAGYYRFDGLPGFLETYQVGIIEGAMVATGTEGEVRIRTHGLDRGEIYVRW